MKKEEVKEEVKVIKDDSAKKTIIILTIGIVIGAIITSVIFLIARPCNKLPEGNRYRITERVRPNNKNFNYQNRRSNQKENNPIKDDSNKDDKNTENKS